MFLALREMKHAKLRYFMIGLIMVLIAWLVLFVSGLANGLASDNASSIKRLDANYLVLQKEADQRLTRSLLSNEQVENIQSLSKDATPIGIGMTTVLNGSNKMDVTFFAVNPKERLMPSVSNGKAFNQTTNDSVVVDQSLQDEGVKIGDIIQDEMTGKKLKVIGFTKNQSFSHTPVVFMNYKTWEEIQKTKRSFDGSSVMNAVALSVDKDTANNIEKTVTGIEVLSKDASLTGIPGYSEEQGSLLMMIAFLFIIAAFVLAVFFYVITIQKMNQFGVLKAIGAKFSYLARAIISQVIFLSVISLIISIVFTYGLLYLLPSSMPFDISYQLVITCSVLFLSVAIIGSLVSLYRVAKVDALDAIGRVA